MIAKIEHQKIEFRQQMLPVGKIGIRGKSVAVGQQPPPGHPIYAAMEIFENKLAEWARNRRRRFASIDELTNEYSQSRATARWVPDAHELMAQSVLRKSPDGMVTSWCAIPKTKRRFTRRR